MATNADEVRRAIERAREADDQEAVQSLEGYLNSLEEAQSVPLTPETEATSTAQRLQQGALQTNAELEQQLGPDGPALSSDDRQRRIMQLDYDRDQDLIRQGQDISRKEYNEWFKNNTDLKFGAGPIDAMQRQVVRDPDTGQLRWSALSPDQMDRLDRTTGKGTAGALASGVVRQVGERLQDQEGEIKARKAFQGFIWDSLPLGEKSRIKGAIAEEAGVSVDKVTDEKVAGIPATTLKKYLDMNPDNEALLKDLAGDEWKEERKEFFKRVGNIALSGGALTHSATNLFGADDPQGTVVGRGSYEGIDYEGKAAPAYPGASVDLRNWLNEADKQGGGIYENLVMPMFTKDNKLPGDRVKAAAETIKEKMYDKEQLEGSRKPFFPEDKGIEDIFSAEMWSDPNTKMPWNDWDGFYLTLMENAPMIAEGVVASRAGGRAGARLAMKDTMGRSLETIEAARRRYSMGGGVIAGGTTEGLLIHDNVASEIREALEAVPMERYRQDETFNSMVAAGMSEEDAKQTLVQGVASSGGQTAFVVAGVMGGSPMSAFFGQSGAGRLAGKTTAGRVTTGLLGEPIQEGLQEVIEGEVSDVAIATIDPENPIFDQQNRRLERFGGGFFVSAPTAVGALGAIEPSKPAGYDEKDIKAANSAKEYMDATNERYKYEMSVSSPEHMQETDPMRRLKELHKLEQLQKKEAETLLKNEPVMRAYFEENDSRTSRAELKMLDALKMRANATLTDIAVARSRRQTSAEMVREQEAILRERARIQKAVTENLMTLEDIDRQLSNIESVQNNEAVPEQAYEELAKEGYGRWVGPNQEKFVITPKGRRATNLLNQQKRHMTRKLEQGYTGPERRKDALRRDVVESAGPVEREQILYTDNLTGVQNRRAFNERAKEAEAVAAVDVDSLAWVNDNMTHASGDRLLLAVADAINEQKGVEVFRLGGDEFAVTGASQEALETAMQAAAKKLSETPIISGADQVTPQITWGKGKTYEEADEQAGAMKADRIQRGIVASRKKKAATWQHKDQMGLFQRIPMARVDAFVDKAVAKGDDLMAEALRFEKATKAETLERLSPEERKEFDFVAEQAEAVELEKTLKPRKGPKPKSERAVTRRAAKEARQFKAISNKLKAGQSVASIAKRLKMTKEEVYKVINAEVGLFQLDYGMPTTWRQIMGDVMRGDPVEIITPLADEVGTVIEVTGRVSRPRVRVIIEGREFVFNPEMNHLITAHSTPDDIAWLTGDKEFTDPLYGPLPQVIPTVYIGRIGVIKDSPTGDWAADLSQDGQYGYEGYNEYGEYESDWWNKDYPEWGRTPYTPPVIGLSEEDIDRAEAIIEDLTQEQYNLPKINLVKSLEQLRKDDPDIWGQIVAEAGSTSLISVRGYMNHLNPEDGIYLFLPNIKRMAGKENFEQWVVETLMHEMIGHYGVRGVFGSEPELREYMNNLVDSFPRIAKYYSDTLGLNPAIPAEKQVLGEEMVAYMVGEVASGKLKMTKKQETLWQRFIQWVKSWLVKHGWDRFAPVKKMVTLNESREEFWNDHRVYSLLQRSMDFVANGKGYNWTTMTGQHIRFMRDGDIFRAGLVTAIHTGTRTMSKAQRKQLAQKYGGLENVPKEFPLFPEVGSPNKYREALRDAVKQKYLTNRELENSGLDERKRDEWAFLRDATYRDLRELTRTQNNGVIPEDWYRGVLPIPLAQELDAVNMAISKAYIEGPMPLGYDDIPAARKKINPVTIDAGNARRAEILEMKIDQKKTQLTKDLLLAHLNSDKALRVTVTKYGEGRQISDEQATRRLFGEGESYDNLSPVGRDMVEAEIKATRAGGYDIGFNRETGEWQDYHSGSTEHSNYSPPDIQVGDYRIVQIVPEGKETAPSGGETWGQHFNSNLMHIRTGLAEVAEIDGYPPIPEALNPAMKGKLLSLIELQSDWLQNLRKGFKSAEEKSELNRRYRENQRALKTINLNFAKGVGADLWTGFAEIIKPVTNLPAGSLSGKLDEVSQAMYSAPYDGLAEAAQQEVYTATVRESLGPLLTKLRKARDDLFAIHDSGRNVLGDLPGTLDARAFDALDKKVSSQLAYDLYTDFQRLHSAIEGLAESQSQKSTVDFIGGSIKTHFMRTFVKGYENSVRVHEMRHRTPFAKAAVREVLNVAYGAFDLDAGNIENAFERANNLFFSSIAIPITTIQDLKTAGRSGDSTRGTAAALFNEESLRGAGIDPTEVSVALGKDTDGFVGLSVSGTKEGIRQLNEKLGALLTESAKDYGARHLASRRENDHTNAVGHLTDIVSKRADELSSERSDSWQKLIDYVNLKEVDVYDPNETERTLLRSQGVQTYEEFEDQQRDSVESYIVDQMIEDMDWDATTNDDGEVLSRNGEAYRSRIVVDDDGDTDNTDAENWLEEARSDYRLDLYQSDDVMDKVYERLREKWDEDGPTMYMHGKLPVEWDEDGEAIGHADIEIRKQKYGESYVIFIDGDRVDSNGGESGTKYYIHHEVGYHYRSNDIVPPVGTLYGATEEEMIAAEQEPEYPTDPNWDIIGTNIADNSVLADPVEVKDGEELFKQIVQDTKKIAGEGGLVQDTVLKSDEVWRTIALRYLISDAVRRGLPGIVWNSGLSSPARGGWTAMDGVRQFKAMSWNKETVTLRGAQVDVIVIKAPDMEPMAIAADRMVPVLGRDLAVHIYRQINGELPLMPDVSAQTEGEESNLALISQIEDSDIRTVHHRRTGAFLGFARTDEELQGIIDEIPQSQSISPLDNLGQQEAVGEVITSGLVTKESFGGLLNIVTGYHESDYSHTFGEPRMAGARKSYEDITYKIWEKELKKYGGKIGRTAVKSSDLRQAEKQYGERIIPDDSRERRIRDVHGSMTVKELTGDTHGWIILSETQGPMNDSIYVDRESAEIRREEIVRSAFGTDSGGMEIFYIEINDKMREEFSGPVAPFHYNPHDDPALKEAAEKIGYEDVSFRDKYNQWREAWKDKFNQGAFDRFYGIKRALKHADESQRGYIQTRLTTSLDSVMKSVMEYGAPVWNNGIADADPDGKGLLDILQPVMSNIDLWGMYMAGVRAKRLLSEDRENLFTEDQIDAMVALGDKYPQFARVAAEYAKFNKKVLDFAQEAGVINPETRPLWENADYVPFYRVEDERLVGPFSGGAGVANQRSPVKRLKGGEANIGNVTHNIMVNLTKLVDTAMKNQAALTTVDALRGSGIVSKQPMTHSQEMIPLQQVKKLLIDRGMNPNTIPTGALTGFQKMFAIQPPEGPGVISLLRDGKKEFYYTDDELLYRAMTSISKKAWGSWMNLFRAPKRLLTTMVTLDPGFMIANFIRDAGSAFVLSRDHFVPVASGIKGFGQALVKDEAYRTMLSSGAAFESGYINQYDPNSTQRMIKKAMKNKSFARTVLTSPAKLLEAWKAIGSATENANRIAVYNAAIRAGKSKMQAAYEAKDLMDFSMSGDWPVIQFLVQTVPFLGARMQGLHRLGRGFVENPAAFAMKGALISMAGMALWFAYRDDERYKELEEWDKDTYFHFWIGDNHYRLPKPFEVGAIFNTIPERIFEYMYSKETDAGKLMMRRFGFMLGETFNMNPVPQTFKPMLESYFNYSFFTGRQIVSPYEEARMAPEEYRYSTSPAMIELARAMPVGLDTTSGKVRSPLHLENMYRGYMGTLGRYIIIGADAVVRDQADYPNPPTFRTGDWPVMGRFLRGDEPRRTKYEEEVYNLIRKTTEIQGSLRFLEKTAQEGRFEEIATEWEPYIRVADDLNSIRQDVSDINKAVMEIYVDDTIDPQDKRKQIDELQEEKNALFEAGYSLRPGGRNNPDAPITEDQITNLIENFGDDVVAKTLEGKTPETFDLISSINTLGMRELERLAGVKE